MSTSTGTVQDLNVYSALQHLDSLLRHHDHPHQRPQSPLSYFRRIGMPENARLTYRPQPRVFSNNYADESFSYFVGDVRSGSMGNPDIIQPINGDPDILEPLQRHCNQFRTDGTHFLTHLDVVASLPNSVLPDDVQKSVSVLDMVSFYRYRANHFAERETTIPLRLRNCCRFAFVQRLAFYQCRRRGLSFQHTTEKIEAARAQFDAPAGWNVKEVLTTILADIQIELNAVVARFNEAVQLESVGGHIPVTTVTTALPATYPSTDCIVCRFPLSAPAVLTIPCKHAYCSECLESWIHSCQPNSHTCPYCRTELFPRPIYRRTVQSVNYQDEIRRLEYHAETARNTMSSVEWFEEEVELQRQWSLAVEEAGNAGNV
ncbi:hypothetical protein BU26DRAFT_567319 [Trematosphaeria pertusa]|uniref:RING-type domain-containing protein n=1 Tax=Trematosphaeria pertusa TaxID=390896 RepID=A0A6A6I8F8_9PLEO|nr:uncharacterized protein BU26DRAFT_567319 [Trematosphaeria pertusa]KAF2245800.1 hypothetical protein BU26DRAFT_567319 [Trematosphaeria pertusa]